MHHLNLIFGTLLSIICLQLSIIAILCFFGYTIKPVISRINNTVIAKPSNTFLILTSYLFFKTIKINPQIKLVSISKRVLWFFKFKRHVHFNQIKNISYKYISYIEDEYGEKGEEFYTSLILNTNEEITLFSFYGSDQFGSQENSSRIFVEELAILMNKKLA